MRYELKRIEIWPVAKIVFILSLLFGFFIGVIYGGVFMLITAVSPSDDMLPSGFDMSLGGLTIIFILFFSIFIPIFYTLFSVIFIALYNLIAAWLGGFRVEFERINEATNNESPVG